MLQHIRNKEQKVKDLKGERSSIISKHDSHLLDGQNLQAKLKKRLSLSDSKPKYIKKSRTKRKSFSPPKKMKKQRSNYHSQAEPKIIEV